MMNENLVFLRKQHKLSQEEVADRIGVSRQALAKWERGDSDPDLRHCSALALLYHVTLDDLVNHEDPVTLAPKGKYLFGTVTVGERGQIVIPKKARDIFEIHPGGKVLMLGDEEQGIALIPEKMVQGMLQIYMGRENIDTGEA